MIRILAGVLAATLAFAGVQSLRVKWAHQDLSTAQTEAAQAKHDAAIATATANTCNDAIDAANAGTARVKAEAEAQAKVLAQVAQIALDDARKAQTDLGIWRAKYQAALGSTDCKAQAAAPLCAALRDY